MCIGNESTHFSQQMINIRRLNGLNVGRVTVAPRDHDDIILFLCFPLKGKMCHHNLEFT